MNNIFEFRANGSEGMSDTSELALRQSNWAPEPAPLDVPRQTLERRSEMPAWQALAGRMTPRDA